MTSPNIREMRDSRRLERLQGRALKSVGRDLLDGFIAQAHAKGYYPHVLATRANDPDSASGAP